MDLRNYKKYSVLMSVYDKEKPEFLRAAIESIQRQTVPTNDFILVCDGPLSDSLNSVIESKKREMGSVLSVIRLPENRGLGSALNEGIKHCRNELVARMDSDDLACKDRCEKQIKIFNSQPDISICSGTVEEFSTDPNEPESRRILPEKPDEILNFAKMRNPFNHPCVMFKKSAVEGCNSYQDFYLLEDYYLWIRMLMNGYKGYNIQEPILHMRAGSEIYLRRGGWEYAKSQALLFRFMKEQGFIGNGQYVKSCILRCGSSLAPNWLRKLMFKKVLRKS